MARDILDYLMVWGGAKEAKRLTMKSLKKLAIHRFLSDERHHQTIDFRAEDLIRNHVSAFLRKKTGDEMVMVTEKLSRYYERHKFYEDCKSKLRGNFKNHPSYKLT